MARGQSAKRCRITGDAGRCFCVDKSQDGSIGMVIESGFHLGQADGVAPLVLYHDGGTPAALDVFFHAPAEYAVLANNHFVSRRH